MTEKLSEKIIKMGFHPKQVDWLQISKEIEVLEQRLHDADNLADKWLYRPSSSLALGIPCSDIIKSYGMMLKLVLGVKIETREFT